MTHDLARRSAFEPSRLARCLTAIAALAAGMLILAPPVGARAEPPASRAVASLPTATTSDQCGASVNSVPVRPRQVDLVLDDSGSMFADDAGNPLDRWSNAKYSLEVFASMLGANDTLNVYRMSDFRNGATSNAAVTMTGSEPASQRVDKVHKMPMQGGGTPYAPVLAAMNDLAASQVPDKWLVVLSDGEFSDRATPVVDAELAAFVASNTTETAGVRVAFLAIGAQAPQLTDNPSAGVFFARAAETSQLLGVMTEFSNRIFARSVLPQTSSGKLTSDVDLDEVLVFAQGADVKLHPLLAGGTEITPSSEIKVSWTDNPPADNAGVPTQAVPNRDLRGTLATYTDVPAGAITVDADGAQTIDVFYTPHAAFGIELRDTKGELVEADKIVGGDYTIDFGFMNSDCELIDSELFGDVSYTAQVSQNGQITNEAFAPGDVLHLERGDTQFTVGASYLGGNTTEAVIDLRVLRPAKPTAFDESPKTFQLSKLDEYALPDDGMQLRYAIDEGGALVDFGAEEWASFTEDSFTVTTQRDDISFDVAIGERPGEVFLLPIAPGGEPLAAASGEIPVTISASHVYDEQLNSASYDTVVTISDDVSVFEHAWYWFLTEGWKWLLVLLAVIWILGYFVRPTFSRRIKQRPTITFKPKSRGKRSTVPGKFETNRLSALLPYVARTGTLKYAQRGFAPMRLKAARGGRIEIQNWKEIAARGNVRINGELLDKQTTKPPVLRPASGITANAADGSYDMTLNS